MVNKNQNNLFSNYFGESPTYSPNTYQLCRHTKYAGVVIITAHSPFDSAGSYAQCYGTNNFTYEFITLRKNYSLKKTANGRHGRHTSIYIRVAKPRSHSAFRPLGSFIS